MRDVIDPTLHAESPVQRSTIPHRLGRGRSVTLADAVLVVHDRDYTRSIPSRISALSPVCHGISPTERDDFSTN